ncbi:MAG: RlpA-like double-psi beta-barrel domain-containing protein, partial [Myxococcota bacterium]
CTTCPEGSYCLEGATQPTPCPDALWPSGCDADPICDQCATDGLSDWQPGRATFYGGNPDGNACRWAAADETPNYGTFYAAAGADAWASGFGCGDVYEVVCTGPYVPTSPVVGTCAAISGVRVVVVDQCPECASNHLDLVTEPFAALWDGEAGVVGQLAIELRRVEGDFGVPASVDMASGSSPFWFGFTLRYSNRRVLDIEWQHANDSTWRTARLEQSGLWVAENLEDVALPVSLRLTNEDGDVVVATNAILSWQGVHGLGVNF